MFWIGYTFDVCRVKHPGTKQLPIHISGAGLPPDLQIWLLGTTPFDTTLFILAIFYPFSQFCEIDISLLSLQKQPNTAPNLFQRGVEYGEYDDINKLLMFILCLYSCLYSSENVCILPPCVYKIRPCL